MTLQDKRFAKQTFRSMMIVLALILGCRFTHGALTLLVALAGVRASFCNQVWVAIACFVFYPLLTIVNDSIKGGAASGTIIRFGLLVMAMALASSGSRRKGRYVLPIAGMFAYVAVSTISSLFGYSPMISYLKLINFVALVLGLWLGFQNLQRVPKQVEKIRLVFLAIVCFLIAGSLITIFIPAYGYANAVDKLGDGLSVAEINEVIRNSAGLRLFSGVTNQSQCLAVVLPCAIAWLMCDMLFVERRISKVHTALIFSGLPLLYMTHSRTALVTTTTAVIMVYGYCMTKIPVRPRIKKAIQSGMMATLGLAICVGIVAEVKDRSITKFLRKTEHVEHDDRSFGQAFTESRQGLMAESIRDFKLNPLLGKGFQVAWYHKGKKSFKSAPIEKGVLPVMILGETGIMGEIAFIVFLVLFYGACVKQRYIVTMTLFTTFLATNLGEATFFSPGGPGAILWVLCAGGGFVIDMSVVIRKQQEQELVYRPRSVRVLRMVRHVPWRFDSNAVNVGNYQHQGRKVR